MTHTQADQELFETLLGRVAAAWEACDAVSAADCFTDDAVYMEPPDRQLFVGRDELLAYFSPLEPGTFLQFHGQWFDESTQVGVAEFSFGSRRSDRADHGVVVIGIRARRIAFWREYHRPGPAGFEQFISTDDTQWEWHAGNYP